MTTLVSDKVGCVSLSPAELIIRSRASESRFDVASALADLRLAASLGGVASRIQWHICALEAQLNALVVMPSLAAPRHNIVDVCAEVAVSLREICTSTTGGRPWPASLALAHWLTSPRGRGAEHLSRCREVDGTILELGSGLGLVGLAAATAAPNCTVTLTDREPEILDNLCDEVELNGHTLILPETQDVATPHGERPSDSAKVHVAPLDYVSLSRTHPEKVTTPFDLVVGADIIFEQEHAALGNMFPSLLRPGGVGVVCAQNGRLGLHSFVENCRGSGMVVELVPFTGDVLELAREESNTDDLCESREHSLYIVRHS